MHLKIDPDDNNPIYIQIMDQIKKAINLGVYKVGEPIPTIRDIALNLRINPNTVAKAIRELEREGVLKTYVGKGAFVTEKSKEIAGSDQYLKAEKLTEQFIKDVKWLGLTKEEVFNIFEKLWKGIN